MKLEANNNSSVVKRIAKRNLKVNHIRNILTCITVALSVALVFAFILYALGSSEEKIRERIQSPQVTYVDIGKEQVEKLQEEKDILWIGSMISAGSGKVGDSRILVSYMDPTMIDKNGVTYEGKLPEKENEIMIPKDYLIHLGMEAGIGDTVSLDLGNHTMREYLISGLVSSTSKAGNIYRIYVSPDGVQSLTGEKELNYSAIVNLKGATDMNLNSATLKAESIAENTGIAKDGIKVAESYFNQISLLKVGIGTIFMLAAVGILILMAAGIVINNIFYIAIAGKVREYGQFRTIGMTQRQVKKLVSAECTVLASRGIPFGIVLGGIMGYVLAPKGWSWSTSIAAAAGCAVLGLAAVRISVRKPANIAASTSPIEATNYTGYAGKSKQTSQLQRSLSPSHLAVLNLNRNKKKTTLTMCSLILAGVLLSTISTFVVSWDPSGTLDSSFPWGEYQLSLTADSGFTNSDGSQSGRMKTFAQLQKENSIGTQLQEQVLSIDGVKGILPWKMVEAKSDIFGEEIDLAINGFSEEDFALMKQMYYTGPDTYEELSQKPGIVVEVGSNSKFVKHPVSVGDMIQITVCDAQGVEQVHELPVLATINTIQWQIENDVKYGGIPLSLMGSTQLMTIKNLEQLTGMDNTWGIEIKVDDQKAEAVGKELEDSFGSSENIKISSKQEAKDYTRNEFMPMNIILYTLSGFLAVFGIINLINTLLTNLMTRQRELGILQSVGMTTHQLRKMLMRENLIYTAATIASTLIIGGIMGYGLTIALDQIGMTVSYRYPIIPVLAYILILTAAQVGLTVYGASMLQKQPLVNRMKGKEISIVI